MLDFWYCISKCSSADALSIIAGECFVWGRICYIMRTHCHSEDCGMMSQSIGYVLFRKVKQTSPYATSDFCFLFLKVIVVRVFPLSFNVEIQTIFWLHFRLPGKIFKIENDYGFTPLKHFTDKKSVFFRKNISTEKHLILSRKMSNRIIYSHSIKFLSSDNVDKEPIEYLNGIFVNSFVGVGPLKIQVK